MTTFEELEQEIRTFQHPSLWKRLKRKWRDLRDAVRYRTWDRYHVLKIRSLEPGYHDKDTILLHASFQLLTDYIEVELACMEYYSHPTEINESDDVVLNRWRAKNFSLRSREQGLKYLDWEIGLKDEAKSEEDRWMYEVQSGNAAEQKALYLWWTNLRSHRGDPYDRDDLTPEQRRELVDKNHQEDIDMLCRLARIHQSLWT